jgi:hypothetical protein
VADARTDECDLFALDQLCELLLFFLHKNRTSSIKCFCNKLLLLFILHLFRTIRNAQPAQAAKMHRKVIEIHKKIIVFFKFPTVFLRKKKEKVRVGEGKFLTFVFFLEENRRIEIRNIKMKSCKSTLTNPHLFACEGDEILFI